MAKKIFVGTGILWKFQTAEIDVCGEGSLSMLYDWLFEEIC